MLMTKSFNVTYRTIIKDLQEKKIFVTVPRIALLTPAEIALNGEPVSFVNGEPVKASINNRDEVYIPIAAVIDIYHDGYSIYVTKKSDILRVVEYVSDALDALESMRDDKAKELYNYIEAFYKQIITDRRLTIEETMKRNRFKVDGNVLGFNDGIFDNDDEKDITGHRIDLSGILVN